MKKIILLILLMSVSLAVPWCNTDNCNASYEFRNKINFNSSSSIISLAVPNASESSYRIVSYAGDQHEIPFNYSQGFIVFSSSHIGEYYLYYSSSEKPRLNMSFYAGIIEENLSHFTSCDPQACDGAVGDASTYYMFVKAFNGQGHCFLHELPSAAISKFKVQSVLSTGYYYTTFDFCGKGFNFCSGGGCITPTRVTQTVCKGCEIDISTESCVKNEGEKRYFSFCVNGADNNVLNVYDVALGYDYFYSDEKAVLSSAEKAPNVSIEIPYQPVGALNYSIINDGAEASNLLVQPSASSFSFPGVYDVSFNISFNGMAKQVNRTAVVYSIDKETSLDLSNISSGIFTSSSVYHFYSDRNYTINFKGEIFDVAENSSKDFTLNESKNISFDYSGIFVNMPVSVSGNYSASERFAIPGADFVSCNSMEFYVNGSFAEKKLNISVTVTLVNYSGYSTSEEISFENASGNVSFRISISNVGDYFINSSYFVDGGFAVVSSNSALFAFNERQNPPSAAPSSSYSSSYSPPKKKESVSINETNISASKESVFYPELELKDSSVLLSVNFSGDECWSRLDGGELEKMMKNGARFAHNYNLASAGNHSVLLRCYSGSVLNETTMNFTVYEKQQDKMTGNSIIKADSPGLMDLILSFLKSLFS